VEVCVGGGHARTDGKEANSVSVITDPGRVCVAPPTKIVVVKTVVGPGRVVKIVVRAADIVVTLPGRVVVIVCTKVVPGKVTI
jgi:hypothetical protein